MGSSGRFWLLAPAVLLAATILAGCLGGGSSTPPLWAYKNGILWVSPDRPPVNATATVINDTADRQVSKVVFQSLDGKQIYALVAIPKVNGQLVTDAPGAVYQPGALVSKENGLRGAADPLVHAGFVVITFDARGVNETGGPDEPMQQQLADFAAGNLSESQLTIIDYLRAFDYLRSLPQVNASRIIFTGESNGGRMAIMAGAIEPRALGVMVISSAGYGMSSSADPTVSAFIYSVNPDNYVGLISPRPVIFLHSPHDPGIPIADAQATFALANQPKQFVVMNCPEHGYCTDIYGLVQQVATGLAGGPVKLLNTPSP